jgi:IS605 OrfB family transposase
LITLKLHIVSNSNTEFVENKQKEYSFAFRKLYKHVDTNDSEFLNKLSEKYNLSKYEINCLKVDVETKIKQIQTSKNKIEDKIISIQKEINETPNNSIKNRRKIFKLTKKLHYNNKLLSKDIVFGQKTNLQRISFLSNNKSKNETELFSLKSKFKQNRILPIYYLGSKCDKNSNRYFNFDFLNNTIIYKPAKENKIELKYKTSKQYQHYLTKLQELKDLHILPIQVSLTSNFIYITFNEEYLNNFQFDEKQFKLETKDIKSKELRKEIFIKFKNEQNNRKLENKDLNRYISLDLNPEYIGVSILEKLDNENFKIVDKFCYDLRKLTSKTNKSTNDKSTLRKNNKLKFEISQIYKQIFKITTHYKCSNFVIEDLNFKSENINENNKEFNRKTKNIWNRNYQLNLITKHCNILGINLIEVNPCYTSFIGNILYTYFDPINASIEIGRRGIFKYIKNSKFYPVITSTIIDTMINRFSSVGDVQFIKDCKNWVELFQQFKQTKIIYRFQLKDTNFNCFSMNNIKSKVNLLTF